MTSLTFGNKVQVNTCSRTRTFHRQSRKFSNFTRKVCGKDPVSKAVVVVDDCVGVGVGCGGGGGDVVDVAFVVAMVVVGDCDADADSVVVVGGDVDIDVNYVGVVILKVCLNRL